MIKVVITVEGTSINFAEENKKGTVLELMLLVQEYERRKHEILHQIEDEYQVEWGDEQ